MSASEEFLKRFDEQGCYKDVDGEVPVTFLTQSEAQYPGRLRYRNGLLVNAEMIGLGPWGRSDESPLDGLKLLLHFQGEGPLAVFIEQGRLVHHFEARDPVSKDEFLTNFRMARNLFAHKRAEFDSPTIDTAYVSDAVNRAALWLRPKSVQGFRASDFPELRADRQAELERAAQAFEAIASQVPSDAPPTGEQFRKARDAFMEIQTLLEPYLSTPEESKRVEKALGNIHFPSWVVNWDYELGSSEEGDAAVWVSVFIEENVPRDEYGRFRSRIVPTIRQALAAEGVDRWPYMRVRTSREYQTV